MQIRAGFKYFDTETSYFVGEKDGVKVYRNQNNIFFIVIPHTKGDLTLTYEGLDFSNTKLGRYDDIVQIVSAQYVEKWVKKNCPDRFDSIYTPRSEKSYIIKLPFSAEENMKLNRVLAHDNEGRSKIDIIKEAVEKWVNNKNREIDEKMK